MSKFQSTISTVAALTTIFGAAVGGWKIAENQKEYNHQQQLIDNLQQQLDNGVEPTETKQIVTQEEVQKPPVVQVEQPPVVVPQSSAPPLPPLPQTEE